MLPACVGRIPAFFNTTSFFPTHAGIFYHAFHFFRHICILQEYLQEYFLHIFRISYTCRKHVSGIFEKCGPFFYLGVAQLEKLFSYLNENMFGTCSSKTLVPGAVVYNVYFHYIHVFCLLQLLIFLQVHCTHCIIFPLVAFKHNPGLWTELYIAFVVFIALL